MSKKTLANIHNPLSVLVKRNKIFDIHRSFARIHYNVKT